MNVSVRTRFGYFHDLYAKVSNHRWFSGHHLNQGEKHGGKILAGKKGFKGSMTVV